MSKYSVDEVNQLMKESETKGWVKGFLIALLWVLFIFIILAANVVTIPGG